MNKITFLGPIGATFSHQAYSVLAKLYGTPSDLASDSELTPSIRNGEIIKQVIATGGYGAIAMETRAEGRVAEPLESFIELLKSYKDENECPLTIIGAIRLKLHFSLLARKGINIEDVKCVVAHPKALGACKERISGLSFTTLDALSNGKAAEDVALNDTYAKYAALAPASAANKYKLEILDPAFEDTEAITTFYLLGPRKLTTVVCGGDNRMLIVFKTPHKSGALVSSLIPFRDSDLNLMQIHSVHTSNGSYDFAIEIECPDSSLVRIQQALKKFREKVYRSIVFGPFPIQNQ